MKSLLRASLINALALALALTCACAHQAVQPEDDSDAAIRARIETLIQGRRDLDLSHVSIDVYSRVVTVTGIVPTDAQLKAIRRLIQRVPGVDQTIENLVVAD